MIKLNKVDINSVVNNLSEEELILGYKDKLIKGVNYLCDMIKVTLGAKGKTVLYRNKHDKPAITKDGVTVARHCSSDDSAEQMAIDIVREASEKTVKTSGDGTTTTAVLAQYLVNRGFELMQNSNISYYDLSKGMDIALEAVCNKIREMSLDVDSNFDKLLDVATVSANSKEIGQFVFDIIKEIGAYGSIEIKKSNHTKDRIDVVKGVKFNKGFYAPHFVSDLNRMR